MAHVSQKPALCIVCCIGLFLESSHLFHTFTYLGDIVYGYDIAQIVTRFKQPYTGTYIIFSVSLEIMLSQPCKKRQIRKKQRSSGFHTLKDRKHGLGRKVTVDVVLFTVGDDYTESDVSVQVCIRHFPDIGHLTAC